MLLKFCHLSDANKNNNYVGREVKDNQVNLTELRLQKYSIGVV